MAFSLEHRVGSEEWENLSKMFHERETVDLKAGNIVIGKLIISQIETKSSPEGPISKFRFSQIRSY